jgi:hypothetical protein
VRFETPIVGAPGRELACSATKFSKLQMVSDDGDRVWTPGTTIYFRSLDFIVNNEGGMSHLVLEGNPNVNHVRARIKNPCTQQLHNWTSSHSAQIIT